MAAEATRLAAQDEGISEEAALELLRTVQPAPGVREAEPVLDRRSGHLRVVGPDARARIDLAHNRASTPRVVATLLDDPNPVVRLAALSNHPVPLDDHDRLVRLVVDPHTSRAMLGKPEAPPRLLHSAASALLDPRSTLAAAIATPEFRDAYRKTTRPTVSPQFNPLPTAADVRLDLLATVADNPAAAPATVDLLVRCGFLGYQVLTRLARHPRLAPATLGLLTQARQKSVRRAAEDRRRSMSLMTRTHQ